MASKVAICNRALTIIGAQTIADLDDRNSKAAERLKIIYPQILEELLEFHPWSFAQRVASLALLEEDPDSGYAYAYQRPSSCVTVHRLTAKSDHFEIIGAQIHTDRDQAKAWYTFLNDDPTKYTAGFIRALAHTIAADLAWTIQGKRDVQGKLEAKAKAYLNEAAAKDAGQSNIRQDTRSTFEKAMGEVTGGDTYLESADADALWVEWEY